HARELLGHHRLIAVELLAELPAKPRELFARDGVAKLLLDGVDPDALTAGGTPAAVAFPFPRATRDSIPRVLPPRHETTAPRHRLVGLVPHELERVESTRR